MNKKYIITIVIILAIFVIGIFYFFYNQQVQPTNSTNTTTYPQASSLNFYPIHEIKSNKFDSGTFNTEGYVVKSYTCPSCPAGAQCKPCMRDNVVISENNKLLETYSLTDKEMILFADNPKQFELGEKYTFSIKILDYKSTSESINDVEIIGYNLFSKNIPTTLPSTTPTQKPTTNSGSSTMTVSLAQEFTLKKGETAQVKGLNVFLKIKDFIYSPCPKGSQCIWSGLAVVYELTVDGKVYNASMGNLPPETPYNVLVKDTDYKTYATFVINTPQISCTSQSGISQDECWRGLAKRFGDQSYCSKIGDLSTKDACFEDLAEQLKNNNLCQNVSSPKQYCQYLKLVSQNALAQCDSIIIFHWRVSCFKEIANKSGQGINACDTLESSKATICRESISGLDY